jgi:hypothetical protein
MVLAGAESTEEYEAAQSALDAAELAYQKALLTAAPDYASQNQEIANAREDLQAAIRELNEARHSGGITTAQYTQAVANVTEHTNRIARLSAEQEAVKAGDYAAVSAEYAAPLYDLQANLDLTTAEADAAQAAYDAKAAGLTVDSAAQAQVLAGMERTASEAELAYNRAKEDYEASESDVLLKRAMEKPTPLAGGIVSLAATAAAVEVHQVVHSKPSQEILYILFKPCCIRLNGNTLCTMLYGVMKHQALAG